MKLVHALLLSWVFCCSGLAAADQVDDVIKLDVPLSTSQTRLTADQIGRHLRQMDEGTSPLSIEDQRIVLESALHSLVKASTPASFLKEFEDGDGWGSSGLVHALKLKEDPEWKEADSPHYWLPSLRELTRPERKRLELLQSTYLEYLGPETFRDRDDPILSVAAAEGFGLMFVGVKLVALQDRLNLGWRNLNATWALPSLLYIGAKSSAESYAHDGLDFPMTTYVRTLAALRGDVKPAVGVEVTNQFMELTRFMRANLFREVHPTIGSRVHAKDKIGRYSKLFTTAWLVAAAAASPFAVYYAVTSGLPTVMVEHPVLSVANASALIGLPIALNVVARGRMRDREANLKSVVDRLVTSCENALKVAR